MEDRSHPGSASCPPAFAPGRLKRPSREQDADAVSRTTIKSGLKSGEWSCHQCDASCLSASTSTLCTSSVTPSRPVSRPARPRRSAGKKTTGPSGTLLASLAVLVFPTPSLALPFLYPRRPAAVSDPILPSPPSSAPSHEPSMPARPLRQRDRLEPHASKALLPDRYVSQDDGSWSVDSSWELYGVTPTAVVLAEDNSAASASATVATSTTPSSSAAASSSTASVATSQATATTTSSPTTLPPGWGGGSRDEFEVPLIVTASVALAVFVFVTIFLLLRKKKRRNQKRQSKEKGKVHSDAIPKIVDDGGSKARFKGAVIGAIRGGPGRSFLRRRKHKNKEAGSGSSISQVHITGDAGGDQSYLATQPRAEDPVGSRLRTSLDSQTSSFSNISNNSPTSPASRHRPPASMDDPLRVPHPAPPLPPSSPPPPSSPLVASTRRRSSSQRSPSPPPPHTPSHLPAYRPASSQTPSQPQPSSMNTSHPASTLPHPPAESHPHFTDEKRRLLEPALAIPSSIPQRNDLLSPSLAAPPATVHLATDDKAALTRLAALASAPAEEDDEEGGEGAGLDAEGSAPAWLDDELEYEAAGAPPVDESESAAGRSGGGQAAGLFPLPPQRWGGKTLEDPYVPAGASSGAGVVREGEDLMVPSAPPEAEEEGEEQEEEEEASAPPLFDDEGEDGDVVEEARQLDLLETGRAGED